jgi:hypothetical protein
VEDCVGIRTTWCSVRGINLKDECKCGSKGAASRGFILALDIV